MTSLDDSLKKLISQLESLKDIDPVPVASAGAYRLMRGAQERAPVDTGFLRSDMEVIPVEGQGAELHVNAEYAVYQEFGTADMEAQPYVRPAIEEDGDEILKVMADEAQKQIEKKVKG